MIESEDLNPFEQRVIAALQDFERAHADAIAAGDKTPTLSISSFTKRYQISRSSLYEKYPSMLARIDIVFTSLSEGTRVSSQSGSLTVTELKEERSIARADAKQTVAAALCARFAEFRERYGPVFRNAEEQWREREQMITTIEDLRQRNAHLERTVRDLMSRRRT